MEAPREWHRRQAHDRPRLRLSSRRVALEPLASRHVEAIREILCQDAMARRWPATHLQPGAPGFEDRLWAVGGLQYAIVRRDSSRTIGLVQGVHEEKRGKTIGVGIVLEPALWRSGWPLEAIAIFVNLLFTTFDYRKIHFQVAESTRQGLGRALDTWLTKEAVYRQHRRGDDGFEDWHVFALFRAQWDPAMTERLLVRP